MSKDEIATAVAKTLATVEPWEAISTAALVERLMPAQECRGADIDARKALFTALGNMARKELKLHVTKGEPEEAAMYGQIRTIRRLMWHKAAQPEPNRVCPHCQHAFYVA